MKIEHECDKCYLKDLCKNYLYRKSFMEEYKPDYYDYEYEENQHYEDEDYDEDTNEELKDLVVIDEDELELEQ